jgi:site-specific DNA-methyltransferase (adenine-specific)
MIELNKIILADCMDIMRDMPDKYFELAIVDPPYGIGLHGANMIKNKSDSDRIFKIEWDQVAPDKLYFNELFRISNNQIIWGGNYFLDILGFCKAPIIWDKLNGDSLYADGEMAWTSKDLPKNLKIFRHQWCGAFKASERNTIKIHPTQKPVALYRWLLQKYAKPGDKIIDTHSGSGSLAIACHIEKFDFLSIEKDEDYWRSSVERLETEHSQGRLF